MNVSLVIPLWNEEPNIPELVRMLAEAKSELPDVFVEAVLVDNGSKDGTHALLAALAKQHEWLKPLHLAKNVNYGGGIYEGCQRATGDFIVYIPGDLQYSMADLLKVVRFGQEKHREGATQFFVKGHRTQRHDGPSMGRVSGTYTFLANQILGLGVKDVNGLPKLFPKSLLDELPSNRMVTFTFDAQLLYTARQRKLPIYEVPVEFLARRAGVSSWSGKRVRVYLTSIRQLFEIRLAETPWTSVSKANG